jgi:hypothetical protein
MLGLVVLVGGAHGCGGTSATPDAAGADGAAGGTGTIPTTCEPAAQTGCAANEKCDLFCGASGAQVACRKSEGTLHIGDTCTSTLATGAGSCVKGAVCLGTSAGIKCLALCGAGSACASGSCMTVSASLGCSADQAMNTFMLSVCR